MGIMHTYMTDFASDGCVWVRSFVAVEVLGSALFDTNGRMGVVLDVCLWVDRRKFLWLL